MWFWGRLSTTKKCKSVFQSVFNMSALSTLKFDNTVLRELPLDKEEGTRQRTVHGACYSIVDPTPVENPSLVAYSVNALQLLGLNEKDVDEDGFVAYFAGNKKLSGSEPAAHCYCGHQFGYFSGQLGDGAAIYLGEIINKENERWELQLKGAGLTPYSRQADGRKVLRSSIREFLCSEAIHHLGIPTTRAGTCVTSDSRVVRDMFYDGHPKMEKCTIVSRIAPTFLRFGSLEIFKGEDQTTGRAGPSAGHKDILPTMLDYIVNSYYPEIAEIYKEDKGKMYLEFYKEIIRRTARLVAMWQCVGFCHGVLNTDNMSIVGVTIDYGPYGFMDYFDAGYICNSSDNQGRYSYKKQPEICKWNLMKLGEMLKDVLPASSQYKDVLNEIYDIEFAEQYYTTMRRKIGLSKKEEKSKEDEQLIQNLLGTMQQTSCDFTNTFCILMDTDWLNDNACEEAAEKLLEQCEPADGLKKRFKSNVNATQLMSLLSLAESNPEFLQAFGISPDELRHIVKQAEKEKEVSKLTQEEKQPRDLEHWKKWLASYRKRLLDDFENIENTEESSKILNEKRKDMKSVNPRIVLRNYMAQEAIQAAEEGDYSKVRALLKLLENPYEDNRRSEESDATSDASSNTTPDCRSDSLQYTAHAPSWASELRVS